MSCYLMGAMPFGLWIARSQGVDLTRAGSGNTGAANAARALGWRGGLLTLALDLLKGTLAVGLAYLALLPSQVFPLVQVTFGMAAILGHNYSVFRRFKGGKGIATTFGVTLALCAKAALLMSLLWLGLVLLTRYSSVGSLTSMAALPILLVLYGTSWVYVVFGFAVAALGFWRHRENLERLSEGRELTID